jgi:hypothetical protein
MRPWEDEALKEYRAGNGNAALRVLMQHGGFSGVTDANGHLQALIKMAELSKSNDWPEFKNWEREVLLLDHAGNSTEAIKLIRRHVGCGSGGADDYLYELRQRRDREELMRGIFGEKPPKKVEPSSEDGPLGLLADALKRLAAMDGGVDRKEKKS